MMQFNSGISSKGEVFYGAEAYYVLGTFLEQEKFSKVFLLVDSNTHLFCLPAFLSKVSGLENSEIIEIEPGEEHKNIETCSGLWSALSELGADRKSLIINVGGGVITDIGGFIASTFMRGIKYINVPTSLLAMVDASVGGKTGVDLGNLKNQIGVINAAEIVLVDVDFLGSLPQEQIRSGLAEIWKHGLIANENYWQKVKTLQQLNSEDFEEIIKESIDIKRKIVSEDPQEKYLRKTLNFGHSIGHALESYFLKNENKPKLLHGEAVAAGMIMACFISNETAGFPEEELQEITKAIISTFGKVKFENEAVKGIIELMKYDKKNENGNINFVLLEKIAKPVVNCRVSEEVVLNAFNYYRNA